MKKCVWLPINSLGCYYLKSLEMGKLGSKVFILYKDIGQNKISKNVQEKGQTNPQGLLYVRGCNQGYSSSYSSPVQKTVGAHSPDHIWNNILYNAHA